jgi:aminoglycoside 6'-N-acetyltransferase
MPHDNPYRFRPAELADLPMLRRWIITPDVSRWWSDDDPFDAADLNDPNFAAWIVSLADRPFAYLQDYAVHAWPDHHFAHLPLLSRGIDQFIGEPDLLGLGHGPAFIRQHLAALFARGVPIVATDPHPENLRAIAAYRKAGFMVAGAPRDSAWGRIQPMQTAPADQLRPNPVACG